MAEIVIAIAAKVAEVLVKPTIRQGQYLFCVNKFIKNLDNEKEKLISKRDSILTRVQEARERTEKVVDSVDKWLNDVKILLDEMVQLEQDVKESHCFQGWCPTWRRYRLCKEMEKKTKTITDLKAKSNFETFSRLASLPGIDVSPQDFMYFESTKAVYEQLLEVLNDDNAYMIGLYGMGGSGKTTFAKAVGKKAFELNLFDRVIPPITVSQTPNIKSMQGKMADTLKLKLEEEYEEGRAQRLRMRLRNEKRVLIIVDDVWAKFDLEQIGIRLDDNEKPNFKVLLTTRQRRVCDFMDCQRQIFLNLLSESDAWTLFRKHAGIGDESSSNLLKVAQEVSNECKGLPVAIKAVGSSLKGAGDDEWIVALDRLKKPERFNDNGEEGFTNAFTCLKLSYDYLRNKEAEMLFLMCSMFPEDHEINIEDLFRYGVGMGLYGDVSSFNLARRHIRVGIKKLVDSCLLFHYDEKHCEKEYFKKEAHVKMHDVVRDVALCIASRVEGRKILVNLANDLNAFAISSWNDKNNLISYQLDAPRLEILLLKTWSKNSLDFSFASSDGVKELKVISILNSYYSKSLSLLQSTQWLTNLRTLCLRQWKLGDLSFLISLTRLEALDLQCCNFTELPKGMEKLDRLKLLDLSGCELPKNFNYEALGSFSQLEELYAVGLIFPSEVMKDIVTLPNLQRFQITRHDFFSIDDKEITRFLMLHDFNIYDIGASKQNLLQRAEHVYLQRLHGGCKNVTPDMVRVVGGMNELTNLYFQNCSEIEFLIDTTSGSFQVNTLLPKLVKLELSQMDNLKAVVSLFSVSVAQSLQQLEELSIQGCKELKHIITSEGEVGTNKKKGGPVHEAPTWWGLGRGRCTQPYPHNSHLRFPNLKKLSVSSCPKLEFIFPISFALQGLLQLQEIQISEAAQLEVIFRHSSEYNTDNKDPIMLPSLEKLELKKLPSFVNVFQGFNFQAPKLQEFSTHECPKFAPILRGTQVISLPHTEERHIFCLITATWSELCGPRLFAALEAFLKLEVLRETKSKVQGIFHLQVEAETNSNTEWKPSYSNLRELELCDLLELRFIWKGLPQYLSLEKLKEVSLVGCPKLKTIFSPDIVKCLPNLESLWISNCEELEEIISSDSENAQLKPSSSRPKQEVCFPRLRCIEVRQCNKLKCLFHDSKACYFPKLQYLAIKECSQLEQVLDLKSKGAIKFSKEKPVKMDI